MLLESFDAVFVGALYICKAIAQKHKKALMRKQRCKNPIGWRQFAQISDVFICAFDGHKVVIFQNKIDFSIVDCRNSGKDDRIFLAETVEEQLLIAAGRIESTLNRLYIGIVILHVVGKHHQLGDIDEPAKHFS